MAGELDEQRLIEVIVGPCSRKKVEAVAMSVQRFLDIHDPALGAAVAIRYSVPEAPERVSEAIREGYREVREG